MDQNFADASRYYEIIVATQPSYETYYNAGISAVAKGDLNRGIELLEKVTKVRSEACYYLGVAYYRLGIYDKSTACFESFIRSRDDVRHALYYLCLINLKQHRIHEALKHLESMPESEDKIWLANYIEQYNRLIEARNKYIEGQYEEALEIYEAIDNFFGYKEMGQAFALTKQGRIKEGLKLIDTVVSHSDDKLLIAQGLYLAGKELMLLKNFSKAKDYLEKHLEINPNDDAKFLLGRLHSDENKYDSAKIYFESLPDSVDAFLFYKGRTDYFLGVWGKSEEKLMRHREFFSQSIYADRALYILASINFKRKDYKDAIDYWRELVVLFPTSNYAIFAIKGVGDAYFNLKEYENALDTYDKIKEYQSSEEIIDEVTLKTYETKYYLKKYHSLVYALRRYVEENPDSRLIPKTQLRITKILFDEMKYYHSLSEVNKIIRDHPDSPIIGEALIQKVRISQAINNKDELVKSLLSLFEYKYAVEYNLYAANELGAIYFEEMKYDSALYYYNTLLNAETYREKAMLGIARTYDILGQSKESKIMIDRLISEFPNSVFIFDAYMLKSKAYKNQGNYQGAISTLEELVKKVGDRPEVYMEIGDTYFEIEEFSKARDNYLKAGEMFKQHREDAARALILAGDASLAIGDSKNAKDYYLQANLIAESSALKSKAMLKLTTVSEE